MFQKVSFLSRLRLQWLAILIAAFPCSSVAAQGWQLDSFGDTTPFTMPSREQLSEVVVRPEIRQQIALLDDDSYDVREHATGALLELVNDLTEIYAVLELDELSTEQRYRLLGVIRDALVRTPRGAIGISMNPVQFNQGGAIEIRVIDLIPGLPGERVLKVGDRIVEIDGKPLNAFNDLTFRVQSKKPGEFVKLKIKRTRVDQNDQPILDANNQIQVEVMELDVELGSADRLGDVRNQPNFPSPVQQQRQIEAARVAESYAPRANPIAVKGGPATLLAATVPHVRVEDDIDRYPAIQQLLMQRRRMGFGDGAESRAMRQQWSQRLTELHEYAQLPDHTPEERAFLNRVIERYFELMQP